MFELKLFDIQIILMYQECFYPSNHESNIILTINQIKYFVVFITKNPKNFTVLTEAFQAYIKHTHLNAPTHFQFKNNRGSKNRDVYKSLICIINSLLIMIGIFCLLIGKTNCKNRQIFLVKNPRKYFPFRDISQNVQKILYTQSVFTN